MRSRSPKTSAIYKLYGPERREFVTEGVCCVCGGPADDCHEVIGGGSRMKAFVSRWTWLRTCRLCHPTVQYEPKEKQMARKALTDPRWFSIEKVCEVWGRAATAIDPSEVLSELVSLLKLQSLASKTF